MDTVMVLAAGVLLLCFLYYAVRSVREGTSRAASSGKGHPATSRKKVARPEKVYPVRRSPYRATSIVNDHQPCSAVAKLLNVRFLDLDKRLPSLPVAGCNVARCKCRYVHHEDRRSDDGDRRSPNALTSNLFEHSGNDNKRSSKRGRRKSDLGNRHIRYADFDDEDSNAT